MPLPLPPCPVCTSRLTAWRGQYRQGEITVDLFYCLDCESFASPSATPLMRSTALGWHLSVEDRNLGFADALFASLGIAAPVLLDIGCGTGTLVKKARMLGGGGTGFDIDAISVEYGRSIGLDLRSELWTPDTPVERPTLITCIMVLEHIHQPRALLRDLVAASRKYDAPLFVSVPWFERSWWRYLTLPDTGEGFHPLRFPADHVTHFSKAGFEKVAREFGANDLHFITSHWSGFVVRA
jgi:SAM-dependent methyltransferase